MKKYKDQQKDGHQPNAPYKLVDHKTDKMRIKLNASG